MRARIFKDPSNPFRINVSVGIDEREVVAALSEEEILHRVRMEIAHRISDELWPTIKAGLDAVKGADR